MASAVAVATALAVALLAPSALAVTAPTRADVQRAFDRVVATGVPGATGVIRGLHGIERYSAGDADVRRGVAISSRDHTRAGSITKAFTSTVILQLVASGRFGLDDSVESLLPGALPDGDQITVRQLLNMSSGLADYCSVPASPGGPDPCNPSSAAERSRAWAPQELIDIGVSAPRTFAPGQGWAYTNTGYLLLGMIIERVTGDSLAAEYRQRIFRPLGLTETRYAPETVAMPRPFSHGYDVLAAGSFPEDITATSPTIAGAAGAAVSTPDDLETFIRAYLSGRLVPARLVREMKIATPGSLDGAPPSMPLERGRGDLRAGPGALHLVAQLRHLRPLRVHPRLPPIHVHHRRRKPRGSDVPQRRCPRAAGSDRGQRGPATGRLPDALRQHRRPARLSRTTAWTDSRAHRSCDH